MQQMIRMALSHRILCCSYQIGYRTLPSNYDTAKPLSSSPMVPYQYFLPLHKRYKWCFAIMCCLLPLLMVLHRGCQIRKNQRETCSESAMQKQFLSVVACGVVLYTSKNSANRSFKGKAVPILRIACFTTCTDLSAAPLDAG